MVYVPLNCVGAFEEPPLDEELPPEELLLEDEPPPDELPSDDEPHAGS